jgi:tetratricopeptide (TPR) repeat protein
LLLLGAVACSTTPTAGSPPPAGASATAEEEDKSGLNGEQLASGRKYAQAAKWFSKTLQQGGLFRLADEDRINTYFDLASLYELLDNYPEQVNALTKALELDPKAIGVLSLRAVAHIRKGKLALAETDVARAEKLDRTSPLVVYARSRLELAQGKADAAIAVLDGLRKANPKDVVCFQLYHTLVLEKDLAAADRAIAASPNAAAGYLTRAAVELRLFTLVYPSYRNWRGRLWAERALADLDRVVRLDPKNADGFSFRGEARQHLGLLDLAEQDYDEAVRLNPGNATVYLNRGQFYGNVRRQIDKSRADMDKVIQLDPQQPRGYVNRAWCRMEQARPDYPGAIADLTKAIKLDPALRAAYAMRGNCFRKVNRFDPALADYSKAIELNPGDFMAHGYRGNLRLERAMKNSTDLTRRRSDLDTAEADFKRVLELNPEDKIATDNLGLIARLRAGMP